MGNLARYIIRASFSQERITHLSDISWVAGWSKDAKDEKILDEKGGSLQSHPSLLFLIEKFHFDLDIRM
jgi:hypothetical protein